MKISEIEIALVEDSQNGLIGFASFIIDDAFYLSSIGIFARPSGGYRLTYPIRKNSQKNLNYFFPINKKIGEQIEEIITKKVKEIVGQK